MLMKQKKMLALTLSQLGQLYRQELPGLAALADASSDGGQFRTRLREFPAGGKGDTGRRTDQWASRDLRVSLQGTATTA